MTIINTSSHKVLLKTGGTATDMAQVAHFFIKDFFAAQMVSSGILPVVIQNADPGVSKNTIWFDPNGITTTDAETLEGAFKLSLDGTSWITNPNAAQWRDWLKTWLGVTTGSSGSSSELIASRQSPLGHIAMNLASSVTQLTDALGFKNGLSFDKTLYPDVNKIVGHSTGFVAGGGNSPGTAYLGPATGWSGYAHTATHWRLWWYVWNTGAFELTPVDTPGSMQVTYGP